MKYYAWHKTIYALLRVFAGPFIKLVMGYRCDRLKGPDVPSIVIANHNTNLDPALVALGFSRHMYFVASEHALRKGFGSRVLSCVFAPISINKSHADVFAIREMLRRLKAGASVGLFAEGDRSYNGTTGRIALSTAKLVKTSGADLITFRIEGGYFTAPRWAKHKRGGKMSGRMISRYPAGDVKEMTEEQVLGIIERDTYENAYERQKERLVRYRGKDLAETIETALYLCPACKKIGGIRSKGDRFFCECGLEAVYSDTGFLEGENLPFSTIAEWDTWQAGQLAENVEKAGDRPICVDKGQKLFRVRAAVGNEPAGEGAMYIDREKFFCAGQTFPLRHIARFAVVGRMTLLFALTDGTSYEVQSAVPRSALKYKEIFRILREKN
ncbi:MAG: 1-acyl-sn-glycerol-3-phosphate acyltransferase [Oscillospiraceae bacterium]|nr:1-acyl-sn-glycerol-3-phosphate acyltransferase [Oscillospiraceae bacterium]